MSQNGKGSKKRPRSVSKETWDKNYQRIFKKNKKNNNGQCDKNR